MSNIIFFLDAGEKRKGALKMQVKDMLAYIIQTRQIPMPKHYGILTVCMQLKYAGAQLF